MIKKKLIFLICSSVLIFIGFLVAEYNYFNNPNEERDCEDSIEIDAIGLGVYIVDGDTLDVSGLDRIRLADINTPEIDESGYQEAKDYLYSLTFNKTVYVDIDDYGSTSYGRIICVIYVDNPNGYLNVNKALLVYGYADLMDFSNNEFNPSLWNLYNCRNV